MNAGPAYQALAEELREGIRSGAFPPSRRLPTEAELSASKGISRQTVRHAFKELVAEGLVYRVRGRGSFAVGAPSDTKYVRSLGSIDDLLGLASDTDLEVVSPLARTMDVAVAGRLGLSTDEVYAGVIRRLHDGVPFSLTHVFVPPDLGRQIAADERISTPGAVSATTLIALVDEKNTSPLVGAHQSITAASADLETAKLLDCPVDSPILTIDRLYFDAAGKPVELAVSAFNPQRYTYRLELRRSVR